MGLILASAVGAEERFINCEYDFALGNEGNTFELTIPYSDWAGDVTFGKRVYIPGTEYGGIVKAIEGDTSKDVIFVKGYTWRGYFDKKLFRGTLSGDLSAIVTTLIGSYGGLFRVAGATGIATEATFSDYVTIAEAARTILEPVGHRLNFSYVQTAESGYCEVRVVPAMHLIDGISQDGGLDFTSEDYRMGINHMIVFNGTETGHLYADENGIVSTTQTLVGIDELTDIYVDDSDDMTQTMEAAAEQFREMVNYKSIKATCREIDGIDLNIGDVVSGIDYITGLTASMPITSKIVTLKDGNLSIQYGVGDNR